jgi:alkyl sulfatase BDS1-like metallo-beta-lactamase superfamily hydrolase
MIYDNERRNKEIVNRIEKTINSGNKVLIWPPNVISKDINELILDGMTENEIMEIIENNTYFGAIAKLKLNQWKRC